MSENSSDCYGASPLVVIEQSSQSRATNHGPSQCVPNARGMNRTLPTPRCFRKLPGPVDRWKWTFLARGGTLHWNTYAYKFGL